MKAGALITCQIHMLLITSLKSEIATNWFYKPYVILPEYHNKPKDACSSSTYTPVIKEMKGIINYISQLPR